MSTLTMANGQQLPETMLDHLNKEYGPSLIYTDRNGQRIRLHQQGFWSVFDRTTSQWFPQPYEHGSSEATYWSEKYLRVRAEQAKEAFVKARDSLLFAISKYVEEMTDLPTSNELEQRKEELRQLKQIADDAHNELDEKVHAPARENARKQELFEQQQQAARERRVRQVSPLLNELRSEFGSPQE